MNTRHCFSFVGLILMALGIALLGRWLTSPLLRLIASLISKTPSLQTAYRLQVLGGVFFFIGALLLLFAWRGLRYLSDVATYLSKRCWKLEVWLEKMLAKKVNFQPLPSVSLSFNRLDLGILVFFALFSALLYLGRIQGRYPVTDLGSDAANIASFAAAWDHPELFQGDAVLNDPTNFRLYATIHVPLIRWLNQVTGNYALAMIITLGPQIFFYLVGMYLLGKVILKSRFWAFLWTAANAMPIVINLGERWGILYDPVPRFTFQAILPFVLIFLIRWRNQPMRWPWIMAFSGLLVYVHPVSAPIWMFSLWLAFWFLAPKAWSFHKKAGFLIGLGVACLLPATPFLINYMSHHVQGKSPSYNLVFYIIDSFFPFNILNIPLALQIFLEMVGWLFPLGMIGLFLTWLIKRYERKDISLALVLVSGILILSAIVPWMEHTLERYLHLVPLETEFVRGIRYLIPFMFLFIFWPLAELQQRLEESLFRKAIPLLGVGIVLVVAYFYPPYPELLENALSCFGQGRLVCTQESDVLAATTFIRNQLPPGATLFSTDSVTSTGNYGLIIRYQGLHPLVYSYKDRGQLVYSNQDALAHWYAIYQILDYLQFAEDDQAKFPIFLNAAVAGKAQYLLVEKIYLPPDLAKYTLKQVYANHTYILLDMRDVKEGS